MHKASVILCYQDHSDRLEVLHESADFIVRHLVADVCLAAQEGRASYLGCQWRVKTRRGYWMPSQTASARLDLAIREALESSLAPA